MERVLRDRRAILFFVAPAILLFAGFEFVPIVMSFLFSLFRGMLGFDFTYVGLSNYVKMFEDAQFLKVFRNSLYYFFIVTPSHMILGFFLALAIMSFAGKLSVATRVVAYIPVVLPSIAVAELFRQIYAVTPQNGLLNSLLVGLHLGSLVRGWAGDPQTALAAVSLVDVWRGVGFYVVIFYAGLTSIPPEIIESARIDGAKRLGLLRHIILPLTKPVIITCVVLSVNYSLKVFDTPFMLTSGGPGDETLVMPLYMYRTAFYFSEYGLGSVLAMFLLFEALVVTLIANHFNRTDF
jgi:raffinose/stachyose/melibiose transport system permease protein